MSHIDHVFELDPLKQRVIEQSRVAVEHQESRGLLADNMHRTGIKI